MATKLHVLVLESERGAADAAVEELEHAGHAVHRCHEAGVAAFPCKGLDGDACPMDGAPIDVALTVRSRPRSQPAPHEDGVRCALQRHIPLVVAGSKVLNPFEPWAAEVLDRTYNVVEPCERAAAAPLARHSDRAHRALLAVLAHHDIRGLSPHVDVFRRAGALEVRVHGAADMEHGVRAMASVRIIGALRELDHTATGIDVSFVE
ncbi:MAG TPA: hypothetical protein VFZ83_05155 [Acidimicrobiia bacterium]|nr:hypothetical protein [Acidimicrobiia bacterium]